MVSQVGRPDRGQMVGWELAVAGEREAGVWPSGFEVFYTEHYDGMLRMARLVTSGIHLAEEVVQDAFIELARRWEDVAKPEAYLRSTVINRSRTRARRAARERPGSTSEEASPVQEAEASPELAAVWTAMQRLSPRRRAALVLRYYEDLPDDEIAEILGCRQATVRSLIHRGLAQLQEVMA